jgi:hypothetical protein
VSRLFRLINKYKDLQALIQTITFSLPHLMNIFGLLFLIFFIYAVLGVFLFRSVLSGKVISEYTNFFSFGNAMITLLRVSTGEDWNLIMYDCVNADVSALITTLYFVSFIVICSFVMLNLFILVIL